MTALSANRNTLMMGNDPHPTFLEIAVAASTHIYQGALVGLDGAGRAIPASTSAKKIMGRAELEADNSSGTAGAINVRVRQGVFKVGNSATTDALTAADVGAMCFVVDDQTVARTDANGTRPVAGTVIQVDTTGVWIQTMFPDAFSEQADPSIITLPAADNFAATPNVAVKVYNDSGTAKAKTAGAGDAAVGILQNTPAAGEIAKVRIFGKASAISSGDITPGTILAAAANGQLKAASALAVETAAANGSYTLGVALTTGSANNAFQVLVRPIGPVPTNGV